MLEMLWEPDDPRDALDERFGFSDGAAAGRWVADTLDKHWGVRVGSCERIVMSGGNALAWVGTPSGRLLAKWSVWPMRFPRLAQTARLASWVHGRGLPASAPVPARDGRLQVQVDQVSIHVQREIAGELLDIDDLDQVRAAGALLARLQDALAAYPDADLMPPGEVSSEPLPDRITGWLDFEAGHLPEAARDTLRRLVSGAPPDRLDRQLVHFDYRSANILCDRGTIVALARAAVMIGTRYHDWGPVPAEVRAEFVAGYQSERPLTTEEADWLDILLVWQALVRVPAGDDPTGWLPSALSIIPSVGAQSRDERSSPH